MEFKEKIEAYQQGKYDLATELLELAHEELCDMEIKHKHYDYDIIQFDHWRPARTLKEHKAEHFIAIHIRTIMERHAKYAYHALRNIRKDEGTDDLDLLYGTLERTGYHIFIDDFVKIDSQILEDIKKKIGYYDFDEFKFVLDELLPVIRRVNIHKKKLISEIQPLIIESLMEALAAVDLSKSEKEIVKFINLLADRKTYHKLSKHLGTRKFRIEGKKYYVTADKMKFRRVDIDKLLKIDPNQLIEKQSLFYSQLKREIDSELKNLNNSPFVYDEEGKVINIKKRYFAKALGIEESAFKKRLKRMQKKKKEFVVRRILI